MIPGRPGGLRRCLAAPHRAGARGLRPRGAFCLRPAVGVEWGNRCSKDHVDSCNVRPPSYKLVYKPQ